MWRSQRLRRVAGVGLATIMLALAALSVIGVTETRRSAEVVSRATALASAYDRAHDAIAAEELSEQHYRLEPTPSIRAAHAQAADALLAALADVDRLGTATDRRLARRLQTMHAGYLGAIVRLFDAVDAGDERTVTRIDNEAADPTFEQISALVQEATTAHTAVADEAVHDLRRVEGLVFTTTTAGFGVGLALLVAFAVITVGFQRRLMRHAAASEYQALHDPLTGLPNRTRFTNRITAALGDADHAGTLSVLMLDLDRFKEVNDTLGHHYGDELLRQVAARITESLRSDDMVARLAGDEFAVLLPGMATDDAARLAERLKDALHRSFALGDVTVDVEVSIGVAAAPEHATTADAVLRCADIAMYHAKDSKTGVACYRSEMHTDDSSRLLLLGDLRRALDVTDQLTAHYQPKVRLGDGEFCGVEALVRWQHPTRGPVRPDEFIPVAETTGLITRLTLYVLREVLGQARAWLDEGLGIPVAVNLSPRCLLDPNLVEYVTSLLHEYGVPARLLRLEVTESAVMANPALATQTLTELHELGIHLSIDDYGTGYSSMAYLKQLPVDELKVDRTFVLHVDSDPDDAILVRGAIELGHNLGMTVVAEGVEDSAHVAALHALGCDIAQGYHYARPMPATDVSHWIRARDLTTDRLPVAH